MAWIHWANRSNMYDRIPPIRGLWGDYRPNPTFTLMIFDCEDIMLMTCAWLNKKEFLHKITPLPELWYRLTHIYRLILLLSPVLKLRWNQKLIWNTRQVHIANLSTRKLQNYLVSLSSKRCHPHLRGPVSKLFAAPLETDLIKQPGINPRSPVSDFEKKCENFKAVFYLVVINFWHIRNNFDCQFKVFSSIEAEDKIW